MSTTGFYTHLREAVEVNTQRLPIYAAFSKGQSMDLSLRLIFLEKMAYVAARYFDWRASGFNKRGIPIIAGDFVPMHPLPAPTTPPRYRNIADPAAMKTAKAILTQYRKALGHYLNRVDFAGAAKSSAEALQSIRRLETGQQCHFAMTVHLIESLGFACANALDYARASQNQTNSLSKNFIKCQAWSLYFALGLDQRAQALHRLGVGILVNDVPPIPFKG